MHAEKITSQSKKVAIAFLEANRPRLLNSLRGGKANNAGELCSQSPGKENGRNEAAVHPYMHGLVLHSRSTEPPCSVFRPTVGNLCAKLFAKPQIYQHLLGYPLKITAEEECSNFRRDALVFERTLSSSCDGNRFRNSKDTSWEVPIRVEYGCTSLNPWSPSPSLSAGET